MHGARLRGAPFSSRIRSKLGRRLGGAGTRRVLRRKPGRPSPGWLEAAEKAAEESGSRSGGGEGDTDPRVGFGNARVDFDQTHLVGLELGNGERLQFPDVVADSQQLPVGGGAARAASGWREVRQPARSECICVLIGLTKFLFLARAQYMVS